MRPDSEGALTATVAVPASGSYDVWLGGSVRGTAKLEIDGRPVGSVRHTLSNFGGYTPVGSLSLDSGSHTLELTYSAGDLHPGSGGTSASFGPVALSPANANREPVFVPATDARELCGRSLDWVEVVQR
jgi:hypothetical protein